MEIFYSPRFAREYKKLPVPVQRQAEKKEVVFRKNPFDRQLKTHKLSGPLDGFYSFSINFSYRIIFDFKNEKVVRFYNVGKHDVYDS